MMVFHAVGIDGVIDLDQTMNIVTLNLIRFPHYYYSVIIIIIIIISSSSSSSSSSSNGGSSSKNSVMCYMWRVKCQSAAAVESVQCQRNTLNKHFCDIRRYSKCLFGTIK
jgi:hypothetical protein